MDHAERETTKHDPRLDEAMEAETRSLTRGSPVEARRRDERLKEEMGDEEPPIAPSTRPGPSAASLSTEEAGIRAQLAQLLEQRAEFPSDRNGLIRALGEADDRGELSARLRMLPVERVFGDPREVVLALSGMSTEEPPS